MVVALLSLSSNVWGDSFVINTTNFTAPNSGSGYAAYNGTRTISDIDITSNKVMVQSNKLQFQKASDSYLFNADAMPGNITKITLSTSSNFTIYVGTSSHPTSGSVTSGSTISGSNKYFTVKGSSSATATTATITVEYASAASTYTVSYTLNGGTHGTNHPTSGTIGTAFAVSAPTRSGYTFTGWTVTSGLNTTTAKWGTTSSPSTSLTSSSTKCVNGTSDVYFKDLGSANGTVTLTANWQEMPKYTVTFNAGSGTCSTSSSTESTAGAGVNLPVASPSSACGTDGWTFAGWAAASQAETTTAPTLYAANSNYKPSSNCTLYAVYSKTESGGGSVTKSYGWEAAMSSTDWEKSNLDDGTVYNSYKHAGSYAGSTQSKTTASIQTKSKIASPTSATCYYTKASSNTNSSSYFVIQVSTDGSNWTDVEEGKTMNNVTQGTFEELTADLSSYSNVYVRFYYTGTTAVRVIDDVSVTYGGGSTTTYNSNPDCGPSTYTVNFVASPTGYGTVSRESLANVASGTSISASGSTLTVGSNTITATPTTQTAQYTYAFSKWEWVPAGSTITAATTATATFTRTTRTYNVTKNLSNCSVSSGSIPATVGYGGTISATISASSGYSLPDDITITGGTKSWNKTTGALSITNVTGDVSITITAVANANYYISGDEGLTGKNWWWEYDEGKFINNKVTFTNVAAGNYQFKVSSGSSLIGGHSHFDSATGTASKSSQSGWDNAQVTLSCASDITFTLLDNQHVTALGVPTTCYVTGNGSGNWCGGKSWDAAGSVMTKNNGVHSVKFTNVAAGDYQFKVTNGTWSVTYGYSSADAGCSNTTLSDVGGNDHNVGFSTTVTSDITISFDGTKICVTVEPYNTVQFSNNGQASATGMPANQYVPTGGKVSEPSAPSLSGYGFGGWYKEAACTNAWNFSTDVVSTNTTLYAKWIPTLSVASVADVVITAMAAGGSAIAEGSHANVDYNKTVTLNYSSLTDGKGLTWKVYKTGDESTVVSVSGTGNGATFTMPAYPVTVAATIADLPTWTITLNPGSGTLTSGSTSIVVVQGQSTTLPSCNIDCEDSYGEWEFAGWKTGSGVETITTTAQTFVETNYTPSSDITLYAVYKAVKAGGVGEKTSETFNIGTTSSHYTEGNVTWSPSQLNYANTNYGFKNDASLGMAIPADKLPSKITLTTLSNGNSWASGVTLTIKAGDATVGTMTTFGSSSGSKAFDISAYSTTKSFSIVRSGGSSGTIAYVRTVIFEYASEGTITNYWSIPCNESYTMRFHGVGGDASTIDWTGLDPDNYVEVGASTIEAYPTCATAETGWTFLGWRTSDYNSGKTLDEESASTDDPGVNTIYKNGKGYALNSGTTDPCGDGVRCVDMYPVFTKFVENDKPDIATLASGSKYYMYYTSEDTRYQDDYSKIDGVTTRIYAHEFSSNAFSSTTLCESAQLFEFTKRADGNWDIRMRNATDDGYATNSYIYTETDGTKLYASKAQPEKGWTIETVIVGGKSMVKMRYTGCTNQERCMKVEDNVPGEASGTFRNYDQDCASSTMYHAIYLGSCSNRIFSSNPGHAATWEVYGDFTDDGTANFVGYPMTNGMLVVPNLAANTTYQFKLRKTTDDGANYTWFGASASDNTYTTSGVEWTLNGTDGGHNVNLVTGAAGSYTFTASHMSAQYPGITVTYPAAYTITFDGNGNDGGSMTNVTNIAAGDDVALPTPGFTKTDWNCIGWTADVDVTVNRATITAGNFIPKTATIEDINSNITLTAVWEQLVITQADELYEVVVGGTLQLTLTAYYSPNITTGATYTWATNNINYATVSNTGLVTGHQAVSSGEYVVVTSSFGTESNHYTIVVKSAACETWGLHYWNTELGTVGDLCFENVGGDEWRTDEEHLFTLPSNSSSDKLILLYGGVNSAHAEEWAFRWVPTIASQAGGCGENDGNHYSGQDAIGYFRIFANSTDKNSYLGFQPVYSAAFGRDGEDWQIKDFANTGNANYHGHEYATDINDMIEVPEGYNTDVKLYVGTKNSHGTVNQVNERSNMRLMSYVPELNGTGHAHEFGRLYIHPADACNNADNYDVHFVRFYRLHYDLDGGETAAAYDDQFAWSGADAADRTFTLAATPTKEGYTFLGWSVNSTTMQPGASVTLSDDVTATAIWAQNYTVTYDLAGYSTSCSSSTVHYCGEEVTVCPAPEDKTGYTFKGWNTDDITGSAADYTPGATFTMPCNDVVFTAHYQADSYTITYEGLEGASNTNPATYTIEDNITFVAPGTRTGYTFTSWTENGTPITGITAGTTGNKTITANWSLNSHNVTFDANGHGTAPTGYANVNYGALVTKPTDPADVDESGDIYTFIGWYKEAGCTNAWDFATDVMPDADLTLYAKWSGVTYEDYRTHCCTPLDAPTGGAANDVHMTTATLSWNEVTNNNGYQVSADQTSWENVLSGTSYDLTGLTAGTPYIYYVRAIGDDNVYCQYGTSAQIVFTTKAALHITYKANSGTGADVVSADIEEGTSATVADNTFTAPTGMSFNGWNTQADGEGTAYAVGATINPLNADLTLYAQWKGETYNITYNLNGGAWNGTAGAATYEFGTGIPTLATNVEKTGFSFQGWYSNEGLTEGPVTTIASDATGDKAFWAKWATAYTVTFIDRDNEPIVSYAAEGDHVVFPADPECGIYSFLGWAITGEISETTDNPGLTYYKSGDDYIMGSEAISFRAVYTRIEGTEACTYNKITSGVTDGEYVLMGQRPDDFSYLFKGHHSSGYMNVTRANYEIGVTTIDEADLPTGDNAPVIVTITVSGGTFAIYDPSTSKYLTFGNGSIGAQDGIWSNWKLTTGSQVSEKACPAGAISSTDYLSSYVLQVRNTSYSDRLQSYANTQNNYVYLFKKTESGTRYYTTNPVCDIPTQITVTYDANGKEGTTLPANTTLDFTDYPNFETYNVGHATDVTDWHFAKWNTQANGLGTDYAADVDVTTFGLRDAITLYAIWETVYTVTLHDNGATSTKTQASEGAAIDLGSGKDAGDCDLDDDGTADFTWKFEGWTTNNTTLVEYPVCPEVVANRSEYVPEANVDLYAVYSRPIENTTDFAVGVSGAYIVKDNNDAQYLGAKTSGDVFAFNAVTAQSDAIVIKLVENDGSYNVATDAGFVEWDNSTSMRYEQLMNGHWTISGSAGNWSMQESAGSRYLCWNTTTRFNLQQSKRTVDLIPTTGTYYFSNPVCQNAFDITFEVRGGEINYGEALPEDYTGLESGAEVAEFPTIDMRDDLMDWTFVGWTTVDYNTQHELDDENASTEAPTSTIYRTGGTNTFTMPSTNVTLYPVFTSAIANEPMDLENGGDYYIYFTSTKQGFHDPYTEIDGQTIRIYAQQVAEHEATAAFASTTSCANAQLFHFEQREAGKWDIRLWNNAGDDYITKSYLTNPEPNDNDFASQGAQPDDYWTIEQLSDGSFKAQYSVNAGSKYFMKGLVNSPETQASATFKCYNQDCDNSNQYYAVYLGSCVERTFSADPMPQASLRLEGTVNVTSRTGVAVRAANSLTLKGIKLEAGQKVTISSTNSDIYFSDTKEVNMSKADKPVNPLKITVPASGSMDMPIYVHYQPTATEDGIDQVDVVASYSYATTELEKSVKVRARHLPEQVVIAAKIDNQWYALPANLNGATNPLVTPITVDETTMTAEAPTSCAYTLWPVKTTATANDRYQEVGERVRFSAANNGNKGLWASDAKDSHTTINNNAAITGIAADPAAPNYEWAISTNDLQVYTLTATGDNNTSKLSVARPTSGGNQGQLVWGTYGTNVTAEVYLLPFITFTDMQATVVEWFQDKVLVELANGALWTAMSEASAQTQSRIGSAEWATAAAVDYTTYGTNMCTFNTGTLTSSYGQNLSVKTVVEETTYQTTLVVPIIIGNNKSVTDAPFSTITPAKYNTMDVVVRDGAVLTLNGTSDEQTTFNTITVEPSSKVVVNSDRNLGASLITLRGGYDEIYSGGSYTMGYDEPQLYIGGTSSATQINYEKRVDLDQMHGMSVPFEVEQTAITYLNGTSVKAGGNLYIDAYDGENRAQYSGTKSSWYYYDEKITPLYRGIGYTISAEPAVDGQNYTMLRAPMSTYWTKAVPGSESVAEVQVYAWGSESAIRDNHKGWNCLGNPYMANFGKADDATFGGKLYLGKLVETLDDKGNWTGGYHWDESTVRYVTIPHDDGHGFDQVRVQDAVLKPFRHFFVQVQTEGTLQFAKTDIQNSVVARATNDEPKEIELGILMSNGQATDNCGLLIGDDFSEGYEMMSDLGKELGQAMAIYTITGEYKLAFNAMNEDYAKGYIPVGYLAPKAGEYTISFDNDRYDIAPSVEHIYLLENGTPVADLKSVDYDFETTAGINDDRFALSIVFNHNIGTDLSGADSMDEMPVKIVHNDKMYILMHGRVYSTTGKFIKEIKK